MTVRKPSCVLYTKYLVSSPLSKHLLEICNLLDIERKMDLYKSMFYCNVSSDRDSNFIKADSLKIELIAGGLNWKQQQYIMQRLQPNFFNEVRHRKVLLCTASYSS